MKIDYWAFGRWGEADGGIGCNASDYPTFRQSVVLWVGDPVFTIGQVRLTVGYWRLLRTLLRVAPKMVFRLILEKLT